jgi:mannose-6-phosphate isomerase-like protein (cupin superfamily)
MNLEKITLDPVTLPAHAKTILAQEGFRCSLLTLAPGDETPLQEARDVEEHLLFVIEGEATVRRGEVNTMLGKDQALLIAKGQAHVLSAGASGWARLLRVDVPPRQVVTPQIVTLPR